MGLILTPEDPGFYETLHGSFPPGWRDNIGVDFAQSFVVKADTLCLTPVTQQELDEYLWGGEYDELEDDGTSDSSS